MLHAVKKLHSRGSATRGSPLHSDNPLVKFLTFTYSQHITCIISNAEGFRDESNRVEE